MALRGDLASVDLAQVFQMLALNQKVGLLSIQSRRLWKVLAFDHRGVTVHHNADAVLEHVMASFVRSGRLEAEALEEVRDHAARTGQGVVDGLLAGGYVEADELEEQYRIELEEEIYDLFLCRDARFEFHENAEGLEGYDGQTDDRFFFHCDSIVMEAARRIDEWAYITERVPSTDSFYVAAVDSISVEEFGSEGAALFELLDGRRSVQNLIDSTGLPSFQACKALAMMLDAEAIEPVPDEELLGMAVECQKEGRLDDAIDLFERIAVLGIAGSGGHGMAADAYREAERPFDAARHLEAQADCLLEEGDVEGAAASLQKAGQLLPTSLTARERLVDLVIEDGLSLPDFDVMAEGKEVVTLLLELGEVERARHLLELLLEADDTDVDLKKALVSVHVKAGDQQRVAELYEAIADDLVDLGRPLEAVGYLQKILLMDRARSDISERVRDLYEHEQKNRRRSRMLGVTGVMFFALIVTGVFYWFYDERAGEEFARIDVSEMMSADDYAGAALAYQDFLRRFPLSTPIPAAKAELRQIDAARQRFEARLANERAAREREIQRIRDAYRSDWKRHRELFLAGHPEEALTLLENVRAGVAKAGMQADMEWALEQQVERSWERLRGYLGAATDLGRRYGEAAAASDWAEARKIALRLKAEYENTEAAARAGIPVEVRTRPGGARLLLDGKPLERVVDGRKEPLVTPTVVLCADIAHPLRLVAECEGFEPREVVISPREQASVDAVLAIVPSCEIRFPERLQTGLGLGEGWLAVGLRGGRLGVARDDGTGLRSIEFAGLKEVESTPHVSGGHAFFISNENTVESIDLESGQSAAGWPVPLPNGAATDLAIGSGRLAVVDREWVVHVWELGTGARLWSISLGLPVAGPPTFSRRRLFVATTDGSVFALDAANGKTLGVLKGKEPITTRVLSDGNELFFGCGNGDVRAVDLETGRVTWSASAGSPVVDGSMAIDARRVTVAVGDELRSWDRTDGAELAKTKLDGEVQQGLELRDGRVYVRLHRPGPRKGKGHDVLQVLTASDHEVLWEFSADGSPRTFAVADGVAAFASALDKVVAFR